MTVLHYLRFKIFALAKHLAMNNDGHQNSKIKAIIRKSHKQRSEYLLFSTYITNAKFATTVTVAAK